MSTGEVLDDAPHTCLAAQVTSTREALMLVVLLYGLAQCVEAFADNRTADVLKDMQPMVGGKPLPTAFMPAASADQFESSTTNFPWRRLDGIEALPSSHAAASIQPKNLQTTSAWQRLADYRGQGRVQLLTLWASQSSMVSLQAGKHGGPSLQWSSRVMNHGGATRGLLDRVVASSLGAAAFHSRPSAHGPEAASAGKTISLLPPAK